jgi:hypothetical protein
MSRTRTIPHRQQSVHGEATKSQQRQSYECRTFYLELTQQQSEKAKLNEYQDVRLDADTALDQFLPGDRAVRLAKDRRSHTGALFDLVTR